MSASAGSARRTNQEHDVRNRKRKGCFHVSAVKKQRQIRWDPLTLPVDIGASGRCLDQRSFPALKYKMLNYKKLKTPRKILAIERHGLLGTATGTVAVVADEKNKTHEVMFQIVIVSALGRHLFLAKPAVSRGSQQPLTKTVPVCRWDQ